MRFKKLLRPTERVAAPAGIKDRRRPERNDQVSRRFIPLLRDPATADIPAPLPCEVEAPLLGDDTTPARGIVFSLALGMLLWIWVAGVVWAVLR